MSRRTSGRTDGRTDGGTEYVTRVGGKEERGSDGMWNKWKSGKKGTVRHHRKRRKEEGERENTRRSGPSDRLRGGGDEPTERRNTEGERTDGRRDGRTEEERDGAQTQKKELGWNSVEKAPEPRSSLGSRFSSGKQHAGETEESAWESEKGMWDEVTGTYHRGRSLF